MVYNVYTNENESIIIFIMCVCVYKITTTTCLFSENYSSNKIWKPLWFMTLYTFCQWHFPLSVQRFIRVTVVKANVRVRQAILHYFIWRSQGNYRLYKRPFVLLRMRRALVLKRILQQSIYIHGHYSLKIIIIVHHTHNDNIFM